MIKACIFGTNEGHKLLTNNLRPFRNVCSEAEVRNIYIKGLQARFRWYSIKGILTQIREPCSITHFLSPQNPGMVKSVYAEANA